MNSKPCHFCSLQDQIRYETEYLVAILDKYPVTQYHTLIIPKRHIASFFSMTMEEHADCVFLLNVIKDTLSKLDSSITGFNIGVNDGNDAGQTVMHCHRQNNLQLYFYLKDRTRLLVLLFAIVRIFTAFLFDYLLL